MIIPTLEKAGSSWKEPQPSSGHLISRDLSWSKYDQKNLVEAIRLSRKILLLALLLWLMVYTLPPAQAQSSPSCSPTPDFTISAFPNTSVLPPGGFSTSTVSVAPLNGLTGTINLTVTNVFPEVISATLNPTMLDVSIGPATSTVAISVTSFIQPGDYFFDVNATISGTLFHIAKVTVRIPKMAFGIFASPRFLTITPGSSHNVTITLTSIFGFAGTVNLTATFVQPVSTPPTLSPPSAKATLTRGGEATQDFNVSTTAATPPISYVVNITGIPSKGATSNSTLVVVTVQRADFAIDASPRQLLVPPGSHQTSTINATSIGGFTGKVDLHIDFITSPAVTATLTPVRVTVSSGSFALATLNVTTSANVSPGEYTVYVDGNSSSLVNFASVMVTVPGFSVTSNPATLAVPQGYLTTSTLSLTSLHGFQDTIDLSVSCSPEGLSATLSSEQASLSAGGTATSILTISAAFFTTPGSYMVTVEGIGRSTLISNSTAVMVTVTLPSVGFTISASAVTPKEMLAGASGSSTITVSPVGGFSGLVSFTLSASAPTGLFCTPPASTTVPGATSLTCKASTAADYLVAVTVTGMISGTQVSRISDGILFHVVDFSISADAVSPSVISPGSSGTSKVRITPLNGFSQIVTLTVSAPSAVSCSLNRTTIESSGTSTLTCASSSPGSYDITVTAVSGTTRHQTSTTVRVVSQPSQAEILGLQPIQFYGLIGGIIALAVIAGITVAVKRKNP